MCKNQSRRTDFILRNHISSLKFSEKNSSRVQEFEPPILVSRPPAITTTPIRQLLLAVSGLSHSRYVEVNLRSFGSRDLSLVKPSMATFSLRFEIGISPTSSSSPARREAPVRRESRSGDQYRLAEKRWYAGTRRCVE